MPARTNRVFMLAVAASFLLHAAALAVVSLRVKPDNAKARQIEFVTVEFAREPPPVRVERPTVTPPPPEPPKPAPEPRASAPAPRPGRLFSLLSGGRKAGSGRDTSARPTPGQMRPPSGVPGAVKSGGGGLNTGTPSSSGTLDLGPGGNTRPGWVPGRGTGSGSGEGPGTGNPAPVGVGTSTSPLPPSPPPSPPPPKEVRVKVCAVSGELPGQHCEKTVTRTFTEGREPGRKCTVCKAPKPKPQPDPAHTSTHAEMVKAKFVSGSSPSIPGSVHLARSVNVTCRYVVGTNGSVSDVQIIDSSGNRALDQEVIRAVKTYRYSPAMQAGTPREVTLQRTFSFQPTND